MCWNDMRPNVSVCNNKWFNVLSEWGSEGYEHGVMCEECEWRVRCEEDVKHEMLCKYECSEQECAPCSRRMVGGSEVEWEWGFAHCTVLQGKENCYYHGKVEEHPDWSVVISTCFGIRYICTTCSVVPMDCTCVDCNVPDMHTHTQHTCTHSCHMHVCIQYTCPHLHSHFHAIQ